MLAKVKTATLAGVKGSVVTVETDMHRGLPTLNIVGLADATIREACGRVKTGDHEFRIPFPGWKSDREPGPGRQAQGRKPFRFAYSNRYNGGRAKRIFGPGEGNDGVSG